MSRLPGGTRSLLTYPSTSFGIECLPRAELQRNRDPDRSCHLRNPSTEGMRRFGAILQALASGLDLLYALVRWPYPLPTNLGVRSSNLFGRATFRQMRNSAN